MQAYARGSKRRRRSRNGPERSPRPAPGRVRHPSDERKEPILTLKDLSEPEIIARKRHPLLFKARFALAARRAASRPSFAEEPYRLFRSGITGELPANGTGGVIVAACNNLYYWQFAITLVLSIERLGERQAVHLHLCAPSAGVIEHVRRLAERLSNVALTWTCDACRLAEGLPYTTVYFAAARFLIAGEIVERTDNPVLCIDVDGIARHPVWSVYEPARRATDVVLFMRDMPALSQRVLAGAVGYNPTAPGRRFAGAIARLIAYGLSLKPRYHVDQRALYLVLQRLTGTGALVVSQMPKSLVDFDFEKGSAIWTPKGWKNKAADGYTQEKEAVDSRFPDLIPATER